MISIKKVISLEPFINRKYPTIRSGINTNITDVNGCPIIPIPVDAEDYVNENPKYGQIDKSFININILFTQSFDNIGLFTNEDFIASDEVINSSPDVFLREAGVAVENYYTFEEFLVTGLTESQLDSVRAYSNSNPFIVDLNVSDTPSLDFTGVISITDNSIVYVIGGKIDSNGNYVQNTGIIYETFDFRCMRNECKLT